MRRALAHAHLHWSVQLIAAVLAAVLGTQPWIGWPILIALVLALAAALRLTLRELAHRPRLALGACVAGQLPGLLLALWFAAGCAHLVAEPFASVAWLQAWTLVWTPLWSLLPDATFHRRGLYLWLIMLLPLAQLGLTLRLAGARPLDLARDHAQRLRGEP